MSADISFMQLARRTLPGACWQSKEQKFHKTELIHSLTCILIKRSCSARSVSSSSFSSEIYTNRKTTQVYLDCQKQNLVFEIEHPLAKMFRGVTELFNDAIFFSEGAQKRARKHLQLFTFGTTIANFQQHFRTFPRQPEKRGIVKEQFNCKTLRQQSSDLVLKALSWRSRSFLVSSNSLVNREICASRSEDPAPPPFPSTRRCSR